MSRRRSRSSPSPSPGAACRLIQLVSRFAPKSASRPELNERNDAMSDGVSRASRLQKSFGHDHVVKDFNLDVEQGEFVSFLGPSGCGKTTMLRMIAGFETPTAGRYPDRRQGRHQPEAQPAQHRHGVPGLRAVPEHDGGAERRLRPEGRRRAQGRDRAARRGDARLIKLPDYGDRYPYQLSGGQQQRVALARALAPQAAGCCCSTSRCRRSTPRSASRCARKSARSSRSSASPPSS